MLLRIGRRRAVGEGETAEEFAQLQFRRKDGTLDLRPSLYEIEDTAAQIVRAYAEHAASLLQSPPKGGAHFDVSGLADLLLSTSPGETRFRFTREQHRELVFETESLAMAFVEALHAQLSTRMCTTALAEIAAHIRGRITDGDAEWLTFARDPTTPKDWKKITGV
jgi:hypothetical protein